MKRNARGPAHAVFDSEHEQQLARHLALLGDLRHCIERGQLVLHYQPKVDLNSRTVSESRRWSGGLTRRLGLRRPGASCRSSSAIELIAPVTRWVLEEALRQQGAWRDDGLDLTMAVNIAAASLRPASDSPTPSRS